MTGRKKFRFLLNFGVKKPTSKQLSKLRQVIH